MDNGNTIRELFSDEQFEVLLSAIKSRKAYHRRRIAQLVKDNPHRHGCEAYERQQHLQRVAGDVEKLLVDNWL